MTAEAPAKKTLGDVLTLGFAMTVAMWGIGYVTHLPQSTEAQGSVGEAASVPAPVVFAGLIACLLVGGWVAGRWGSRGWKSGLFAGMLTGLLNLLVLGAVLRSLDESAVLRYALVWAPASIVICGAISAIGAMIGSAGRRVDAAPPNWPAVFALVAWVATLLLLSIGGTVTGAEAGLAVPDWPNSFGSNMFLYPIAKMTGGIYFEHSHRLFGSLVGLITLVLTIWLTRVEPRKWVRVMAWLALVLVSVQGLLGGLRVTGELTLSTDRAQLTPSLALAMLHGALGQIFFATLAAMFVVLSRAWTRAGEPTVTRKAGRDFTIGIAATFLVLVQLMLGVVLRHLGRDAIWALHMHIAVALLVGGVAGAFGVRAWGIYAERKTINRFGRGLLVLLIVQFGLGFAAFAAVLMQGRNDPPQIWQVWLTTLHQTVGALILATTVSLVLYELRMLRPPAPRDVHASSPLAEQAS